MSQPAAIFAIGDPLSYGLFDGRQVPCKVSQNDTATGLPSLLEVTHSVPHLCAKGARIDIEPSFWDGLHL